MITDDTFTASFGVFKVSTPRGNISGAHVTEHYRWWTAIGVRLSHVDSGLSFGTNYQAGVCIHFTEPVTSLLSRRTGHEALTVTVEDPAALVQALGFGTG